MIPEPASGPHPVRVAFRTLGCKVNRVESDAIAAELVSRGALAASEDDASVVVINTCTVTGEADAKARKAVRQALAARTAPIVVVTGCLASLDADGLRSLGERVVVEADKTAVAARVSELLGADEVAGHGAEPVAASAGTRTRAMLKIQDGCDNFCSYCIVPYARGVPRSVPAGRVAADGVALRDAGVREVVLTGINLGRYRDAESGADLAEIVSLLAESGVERIRLSSIEPPDLTDRLISVLAGTQAFCEHLHVPLQSGSDAVLSAMGRAYDTAFFAERIEAARDAIPGVAITTDVIAGFPEESDAHHAETLAFIEACGFSKLHVFRYSERPGTPAALMAQVAPTVKSARAAELRLLGERLRRDAAARLVGSRIEVLVEGVEDGVASGTTREYFRVSAPAGSATVGDLIGVEVSDETRFLG